MNVTILYNFTCRVEEQGKPNIGWGCQGDGKTRSGTKEQSGGFYWVFIFWVKPVFKGFRLL